MEVGRVSVPLKYVHVCVLTCVRSTYRAVVDSLVNISKLALSDAAAQLDPVPLDLIVPRWERRVGEKMGKDRQIECFKYPEEIKEQIKNNGRA